MKEVVDSEAREPDRTGETVPASDGWLERPHCVSPQKLSVVLMALASIAVTALLAGCASGGQSPTHAQPTSGVGNLEVSVKDEGGNPLWGAKVVSLDQPEGQLNVNGITTQSSDTVVFNGIKAGQYQFYVSRFDYELEYVSVTVVAGQTATITVKLKRALSPTASP